MDLICKAIAPIEVRLQDNKLPMYLDEKEWEASRDGWCYEIEKKTAKIKYNNIKESYEIKVNFNVKDLISI